MSRFSRRVQASTIANKLHFRPDDHMTLPDRRFWTHAIFNAIPDYSDNTSPTDRFYGALYPLELVNGNYLATPRSTSGVSRLLEAGITGIQILLFPGSTWMVDQWATAADATMSNPDPAKRVLVAGCLQVDSGDTVTMVQDYIAIAKNHTSISKIDGKYVLYTFASKARTPAQWAAIRSDLAAKNLPVYFIFDYQLDASQYGNTITPTNEARATADLAYCEANWLFDDSLQYFWDKLVPFVNKYRQPFAGGIMPGYNRETQYSPGVYGGYRDAEGTQIFRTLFEQYRDTGIRWQNIVTWSDVAEQHEVRPTSHWNKTRSDICAFYSALHRNTPMPRPQAELYITTPQAIRVGDAIKAEAMVLNGGGTPVTATVQLVDQSGQPLGSTYTSSLISGGYSGDVTTPGSLTATSGQANTWIRARAKLYNQSGTLLQEVTSAPILIYASGATPTTPFRRTYYSIPAYAAIPESPTLTLTASPVSSPSSAKARVTTNTGRSMRFIEVLQNTRQVWMTFDVASYVTSSVPDAQGGFHDKIPMGTRHIYPGDQTVTATAQGFYVGRVIDDQERVGYSDPVYVQ